MFMSTLNIKAPPDMIPASQLPPAEGGGQHPGKKGTYAGFLLVIVGMVASVVSLKYAPENVDASNWIVDCPSGYEKSCKANSAVLRFSFALSLIFAFQLLITCVSTRLYDSFWLPKAALFAGLCALFFFVDARVFDQNGYAWFARIGGFFYVMVQQVLLLDFAMTWNSYMMAKADEAGGIDVGLCRNKWLLLVLAVSLLLFGLSFSGLGVMFHYFAGCRETNAILSISLITSVVCTALQMASGEGSVLTSSIMSAYFSYVCFSAISLNPNTDCNPTLAGSAQTLSAAIGMAITLLSLSWSTYSIVTKIPASLHDTSHVKEDRADRYSGIVHGMSSPELRRLLQEVCVIYILISCYYAMVLTNWATLQADFNIASAKTGLAAMWLQASAVWVAALFYSWRLVAPWFFPDREF